MLGKKAGNFELMPEQELRKYSDAYVSMELNDGVLFFGFREGATISLDIAREVVRIRNEFCEGESYPVLIEDGGVQGLEKDARDFLSGPEGMRNIMAGAMVATNIYNRFLGNFVLRITYSSSKVPAKLFDNRDEALQWLEQFK